MQRKKPTHSRRDSENISKAGSICNSVNDGVKEEVVKDEEYKLMYHQTYKAACFTHVSPASEIPYWDSLALAADIIRPAETNDDLAATLESGAIAGHG